MRKSLKKIALGCAATMALSVVMSASAFAADLVKETDFTYDKDAGTVSVLASDTVKALTTGQYTVLIYDLSKEGIDETALTGDDIEYINQDAADKIVSDDEAGTGTFENMGLRNQLIDGHTYVMKIGGENVAAEGILRAEFTIENGQVVMLGDVTGDGQIQADDSGAILNHVVSLAILEGDALAAADVTKDGAVQADDAGAILNYVVGLITEF